MMNNHSASYLIKTEKEAYRLLQSGQFKEAAKLFEIIVSMRPDFEHGSAWYHLACCCEDIGELDRADRCFREALKYEPENHIYLRGLASFAYLYGDIKEAYELNLKVLNLGFLSDSERTELPEFVRSLGEKIGLNKEIVDLHIQNALSKT